MATFDPLHDDHPVTTEPTHEPAPAPEPSSATAHGPGWDAALTNRQLGKVPGFIGHNESIDDFRARADADAQAEADAVQNPAPTTSSDVAVWDSPSG